jgi:hypothetical protein
MPLHHRPALSDGRVRCNAAGQLVLKFKTPWRDGATHLMMSPLEFVQRPAAPVPATLSRSREARASDCFVATNSGQRMSLMGRDDSPLFRQAAIRERRLPAPMIGRSGRLPARVLRNADHCIGYASSSRTPVSVASTSISPVVASRNLGAAASLWPLTPRLPALA